MSGSEPKMQTVYLNGSAVGHVPAMGDLEKDREVAQQLLKDKGLYKGRMKRGRESLLSWRDGNRVFCNAVTRITFVSAPES